MEREIFNLNDIKIVITTEYKFQLATVVVFALAIKACKTYFGGAICTCKDRLDGKTVIVTGANTGIGRETALDLAKRGARVILACRNVKTANEVLMEIKNESGNKNVVVRKLDLSSFVSVKEFSERINAEEDRIDILINNAG